MMQIRRPSPLASVSSTLGRVLKRGLKQSLWRRLGRLLRWGIMATGVVTLLGGATVLFFVLLRSPSVPTIRPGTVLTVTVGGSYVDYDRSGSYRRFLGQETRSLKSILETLKRAEKDDRVVGLMVRLDDFSMGLANVQELREAILNLSKAGKMTLVYADTLNSTKSYYLASAFQHIWLQPMGDVALKGIATEQPFVQKALSMLSVEPRISKRKEYKTGADMFMESGYTKPARDAEEALLTSLFGQIARDISQQRNMSPEDVIHLMNKGPFNDRQALEHRLIDRIAPITEVRAFILSAVKDFDPEDTDDRSEEEISQDEGSEEANSEDQISGTADDEAPTSGDQDNLLEAPQDDLDPVLDVLKTDASKPEVLKIEHQPDTIMDSFAQDASRGRILSGVIRWVSYTADSPRILNVAATATSAQGTSHATRAQNSHQSAAPAVASPKQPPHDKANKAKALKVETESDGDATSVAPTSAPAKAEAAPTDLATSNEATDTPVTSPSEITDDLQMSEDEESSSRKEDGIARETFVTLTGYAQATENDDKEKYASDEIVAVIYASGDIVRDGDMDESAIEHRIVGSYATSKLILKAGKNKDVKAIILRLDTPGGSPVASETIRAAVLKARKQKPVIVSMGNAAASGGYWIASAATQIVALPATITGSIGVFGGKFVTKKLWERLGVNWGLIEMGEHAAMDSSTKDYTESERALIEQQMDYIYESFVERVAEGRKLDPQHVEACARGRVWTGEDAKTLGLVDALGGLEVALTLARELGKCPDARTEIYPERRGIYDAVVSLARGEPMDEPLLSVRATCVAWILRVTLGLSFDEQSTLRDTVNLLRPQPALKNTAVARWSH